MPSRRAALVPIVLPAVLVLVMLAGLSPVPGRAAPAATAGRQVAQAAPVGGTPLRIRGRLAVVDAGRVVVTTSGDERVSVGLREPLRVTGMRAATLADITPGVFVGTAARPEPDGSLRALEVHIFPESMRGTGEGHRPMDLPETTMTNANVEEAVQRVEGRMLVLRYRGGEVRVLVPAEAPVVRMEPGDRSLLQPGAPVSIFGVKGPDGSLTTSRVTVGIDVVPPL